MSIKESTVEDLFDKYGRISSVVIKQPQRPPAFAFVTFEDYRDAEDAVKSKNGYEYEGLKLRVEVSKGERRDRGRDRDRRDSRSRSRGRNREAYKTKYSDYGIVVSNLPRSASWQDLKDFGRKAGEVKRADIIGHGEGILEFSSRSDYDTALKILDDVEFVNRFDKSYVRAKSVIDIVDRRSHSRSYSRDRHRRDRSYSRDRRRDRSRGRRYSRSESRSPSRSRSRSYRRSPSPERDGEREIKSTRKEE